MKFLTFTDLHDDTRTLKKLVQRASKEDIDFIICSGDFSNFGRGLRNVFEKFNALGKKFFFIPGNHEEGLDFKEFKDLTNCINLNFNDLEVDNYILLGHGGGGFAQEDSEFRKLARKWYGKYKDKKILLVLHMPPYGNKTDYLDKRHVGNFDYRKFIERITPKLVVCGHLHETFGEVDKIGSSKIVNPGKDGMVIELK